MSRPPGRSTLATSRSVRLAIRFWRRSFSALCRSPSIVPLSVGLGLGLDLELELGVGLGLELVLGLGLKFESGLGLGFGFPSIVHLTIYRCYMRVGVVHVADSRFTFREWRLGVSCVLLLALLARAQMAFTI